MAATVHSSILAIGSEEDQTKAWASLLFDVPFQVALVAMAQHLRTSPYKPVPANIIDIADKLRTSQIQTAELAWQEVVRQYGKRGELHFTSAITYRVVRLMGGISAIAHLLPQLDYVDMDGALLLAEDIATGVTIKDGVVSYSNLNGTGVTLL